MYCKMNILSFAYHMTKALVNATQDLERYTAKATPLPRRHHRERTDAENPLNQKTAANQKGESFTWQRLSLEPVHVTVLVFVHLDATRSFLSPNLCQETY